jgi:hypothetical protein
LLLRQEMKDRRGIVVCLAGLAGIAFSRGDSLRAARLAGTAEAMRAAIKAILRPEVRPLYEHTLSGARAALGETAFNAAWDEGKKMTLQETIAVDLASG